MEHDQNGRRPKWKTTKMEDDQNGSEPKLYTSKIEYEDNLTLTLLFTGGGGLLGTGRTSNPQQTP